MYYSITPQSGLIPDITIVGAGFSDKIMSPTLRSQKPALFYSISTGNSPAGAQIPGFCRLNWKILDYAGEEAGNLDLNHSGEYNYVFFRF